jgi:hypothetical protein
MPMNFNTFARGTTWDFIGFTSISIHLQGVTPLGFHRVSMDLQLLLGVPLRIWSDFHGFVSVCNWYSCDFIELQLIYVHFAKGSSLGFYMISMDLRAFCKGYPEFHWISNVFDTFCKGYPSGSHRI